jgi:hypothetical protein
MLLSPLQQPLDMPPPSLELDMLLDDMPPSELDMPPPSLLDDDMPPPSELLLVDDELPPSPPPSWAPAGAAEKPSIRAPPRTRAPRLA